MDGFRRVWESFLESGFFGVLVEIETKTGHLPSLFYAIKDWSLKSGCPS